MSPYVIDAYCVCPGDPMICTHTSDSHGRSPALGTDLIDLPVLWQTTRTASPLLNVPFGILYAGAPSTPGYSWMMGAPPPRSLNRNTGRSPTDSGGLSGADGVVELACQRTVVWPPVVGVDQAGRDHGRAVEIFASPRPRPEAADAHVLHQLVLDVPDQQLVVEQVGCQQNLHDPPVILLHRSLHRPRGQQHPERTRGGATHDGPTQRRSATAVGRSAVRRRGEAVSACREMGLPAVTDGRGAYAETAGRATRKPAAPDASPSAKASASVIEMRRGWLLTIQTPTSASARRVCRTRSAPTAWERP